MVSIYLMLREDKLLGQRIEMCEYITSMFMYCISQSTSTSAHAVSIQIQESVLQLQSDSSHTTSFPTAHVHHHHPNDQISRFHVRNTRPTHAALETHPSPRTKAQYSYEWQMMGDSVASSEIYELDQIVDSEGVVRLWTSIVAEMDMRLFRHTSKAGSENLNGDVRELMEWIVELYRCENRR